MSEIENGKSVFIDPVSLSVNEAADYGPSRLAAAYEAWRRTETLRRLASMLLSRYAPTQAAPEIDTPNAAVASSFVVPEWWKEGMDKLETVTERIVDGRCADADQPLIVEERP